ncbi:hypothetical protein PDM28_10095 [Stenotrophomonas aracearum]|uniref:DUF5666 domain-containing protein n=1 Tax=Stenotrophomonas aracearum TaxID=3003272 RepID=A0ABY9Y8R0_9GAMM|nr:hypothetical protein [Stenotrophomonas sp. A5588]WNH47062.1 hypothetical protein PDM28_10095 [Stenotrophomonas sp. A5588]
MRVAMLSSSVILITAALAAGAAHAAQPAAAPAARAMPAPVNAASAGVTLQGQITALNTQTRAVTVTGTDGGAVEFVAGPEVRNFNQLKVGDRVTLDYKAAVALALEPAGSAPVGVTKSQAKTVPVPGQKPGGARSNTIEIVTEVTAVNPDRNTIALRGASGNTQLIAVERPDLRAKLPSVKRGDLVKISYTEAVALAIRRDSP